MDDDKLTRNFLYTREDEYCESDFNDYLYEICSQMDIPSPVVLPTHRRYFKEFNVCTFKRGDFVETVDFDKMTLEYCLDDNRKQKDFRFLV